MCAQELQNSIEILALWGNEIVALAETASEYERLIGNSMAVQDQIARVEKNITEYGVGRRGRGAAGGWVGWVGAIPSHTGLLFTSLAPWYITSLIAATEYDSFEYTTAVRIYADTYMAALSSVAVFEVRRQRAPHINRPKHRPELIACVIGRYTR